MTPSRPLSSNLVRDNKSANDPIPPEAIIGWFVISMISLIKSSLGPLRVPSVLISVIIKFAILKPENSLIKSVAFISDSLRSTKNTGSFFNALKSFSSKAW